MFRKNHYGNGNKMWVNIYILSQIIGKKYGEHKPGDILLCGCVDIAMLDIGTTEKFFLPAFGEHVHVAANLVKYTAFEKRRTCQHFITYSN